jgi:HSP20 family molecular chaperone IbpA
MRAPEERIMTGKTFTADLGQIMDEAFRAFEQFGESFGQEARSAAEQAAEHVRRAAEACGGRGPFGDCYPGYLYPPANVYLTPEKQLVLEVALAGFNEKDVSVQFRGDYLVFSAKAPAAAAPDERTQWFKRRLRMRDVDEQRYFVPADRFEQAASQATFKNGLLRIVVPPRESATASDGIRIDIRTEGTT